MPNWELQRTNTFLASLGRCLPLNSRSLDSYVDTPRFEYFWLLPLLEEPYPQAATALPALLARLGVPVDATDVSLSRIVVTGLSFGSDYWFTLAARWLEQGFPVDREIARVVDERRSDRSLSQGARHLAFGIVQRWERRSRVQS